MKRKILGIPVIALISLLLTGGIAAGASALWVQARTATPASLQLQDAEMVPNALRVSTDQAGQQLVTRFDVVSTRFPELQGMIKTELSPKTVYVKNNYGTPLSFVGPYYQIFGSPEMISPVMGGGRSVEGPRDPSGPRVVLETAPSSGARAGDGGNVGGYVYADLYSINGKWLGNAGYEQVILQPGETVKAEIYVQVFTGNDTGTMSFDLRFDAVGKKMEAGSLSVDLDLTSPGSKNISYGLANVPLGVWKLSVDRVEAQQPSKYIIDIGFTPKLIKQLYVNGQPVSITVDSSGKGVVNIQSGITIGAGSDFALTVSADIISAQEAAAIGLNGDQNIRLVLREVWARGQRSDTIIVWQGTVAAATHTVKVPVAITPVSGTR